MAYSVEILDKSGNYLATVRNLAEIDKTGNFLEYDRKLSHWGTCKFRVGTKDPLLGSEGNILVPFKNHVRIKRSGVTVWQGAIVRNPYRTKNFIEVEARDYLYLLSRTLVKHDPSGNNGEENYRTVRGGTMANAITTLIGEAITDMAPILNSLTTGTVDNPTFPADYKDSLGNTLSGTWTWTDNFMYKVDYRDLLYVIQTMGAYAAFDFEITPAFVFNFKQYIGTKQPQLVFRYGDAFGNVEDYNAPLDGDSMANYLVGIAADNNFQILHKDLSDTNSMNTYGKVSGVAPYGDVKNLNLLTSRLREELTQVATPDGEVHLLLNERAYPQGQYGLGDTVTVKISDHVISVNKAYRIVAIETKVHATGKESIKLFLNPPRENQ